MRLLLSTLPRGSTRRSESFAQDSANPRSLHVYRESPSVHAETSRHNLSCLTDLLSLIMYSRQAIATRSVGPWCLVRGAETLYDAKGPMRRRQVRAQNAQRNWETGDMTMKLSLMERAARNRRRARLRAEAKQPGWLATRSEAQEAADFRAEVKKVTERARKARQLASGRKKARDAKYQVVVLSGGAIETNRRRH
jgi:hypothetical protein